MPDQQGEWKTVSPPPSQQGEWQTVTPQAQTPAEEPSWYTRAWDTAAGYIPEPVKNVLTKAVTPLSTIASRTIKPLSEAEYNYGYNNTGLLAKLARIGGAWDESMGNALDFFSSPAGAASLVLPGIGTVAGQALPRVAQAAAIGTKAVGAGLAGMGAEQVLNPRSTMAERVMGGTGAVLGGLAMRGGKPAARVETQPAFDFGEPPPVTPKAAVTPEAMPVRPPSVELPVAKPVAKPSVQDVLPAEPELDLFGIPKNRDLTPEESAGINKHLEDVLRSSYGEDVVEGQKAVDKLTGTIESTPIKAEYGTSPQDMLRLIQNYGDVKKGLSVAFGPDEAARIVQTLEKQGVDINGYGLNAYQFATKISKVLNEKAAEFNPNTLKGLVRTPTQEVEFVDPKTGQTRPASEAQPGDVPNIPETSAELKIGAAKVANFTAKESSMAGRFKPGELVRHKSTGQVGRISLAVEDLQGATTEELNGYRRNITTRTEPSLQESDAILLKEIDDEFARRKAAGYGTVAKFPGTKPQVIPEAPAGAEAPLPIKQPSAIPELETKPRVTPESMPVRPQTEVPPVERLKSDLQKLSKTEPTAEQLPRDLAGAKPRFNLGTRFYVPQFKDDLDKALYIIAQTRKSSRDADYLEWVMKQTGLDETQARAAGQQIKATTKGLVTVHDMAKPGYPEIIVPPLFRGNKTYSEFIKGKPAVSTGPVIPENVKPPIAKAPITEATAAEAPPKAGGGGKPPKPPEPPGGGEPPSEGELPFGGQQPQPVKKLLLKKDLQAGIEIRERAPRPPEPEQTTFNQVWNAARSAQSIDLPGVTSAAFRQARMLVGTPKWFAAWNSAVKAFGSAETYKMINQKISSSKYFQPRYEPVYNKAGKLLRYTEKESIAEELGVKMTDVINHREEAIMSNLIEKVPVYGRYATASNRAYTAFLNDLRAAKFEQMMKALEADGRVENGIVKDMATGKKIAEFVNNATGRGSLKFGALNLEPIAKYLGWAMYSPRAFAARMKFLNPYNYIKTDPIVRKEYIKALAGYAVSLTAFDTLASLVPGVHVSFDPNNSDFMKPRIGNFRMDPGGGFLQLMVLLHREMPENWGGGGTTSSVGKPGKPGKFTPFGKSRMSEDRWSLPGRYLMNQANPSLSFVKDILKATQDQPFDVSDRVLQMAAPMYATDFADAMNEDQDTAAVFAPLFSSVGIGAQTYEKGDFGKPKITPFIKQVTGLDVPTTLITNSSSRKRRRPR